MAGTSEILASASGMTAPLDVRDPEVLVALFDTVAILDHDLRPRFVFGVHGLQAGFGEADSASRLGDWAHPDDYDGVVAVLAECLETPGVDIPVDVRVRHQTDGWHVMTLAFRNLLAHPDVQGILVRATDHTVFEREARLRMLVSESPVGIYEVGVDGRCTFVNPTWCRLVGVSSDQALGYGWRDLVHPDDLGPIQVILRRAVDAGTTFVGEFRFRQPGGGDVWVSAHAAPLRGVDGEVTGYLGTIEDVTTRRLMADLVASNDDRIRRLLESSNDIVVVIDPDGVLTYVSPAAERVLGRRPSDLTGRPVTELMHPDDIEWASELIRLAVQNAGPFPPQEIRLLHADGTLREIEVTTTNLVDDPAVGGLLVNARDLTERRRAAARLHEAQARFEQVFEHATVGIAVLNVDGRFLRVNRATCLMLGTTEQYFVNETLFSFVHHDDLPTARNAHKRLVAGDEPYALELRFRRTDGEVIWGRTSASVVRDESGAPLYTVCQIEDVTEQHRLAERLAYDATHDRLTGLASRPVLFEHLDHGLARVRRSEHELAVLFIDLDGFKRVNDTLGHAVGDELLIQVGQRLRTTVRASDVVVRLGGDEFVVYCPEIDAVRAATDLADRVLDVLTRPFVVGGHDVMIGGSIGVAVARGDDPVSGEQLLSNADVAAYRAKRHGRGRVEVFDEALRRELSERRRVVRAVTAMLDEPAIPLLFAPIVHLAGGDDHVVGFDCGIDWARAGLPDAAATARIVEESGLSRALGVAVLHTMLDQLAAWEANPPRPTIPGLSTAMTVATALSPEMPKIVEQALAESGVQPGRCWLGVPEAALTDDIEVGSAAVSALVDLGIGVVVRDFGAGVSSLEGLRRLPATTITLAAPLVDALAKDDGVGTALMTSVLRFTRALGRLTVATGIATLDDARRLADLGCDFGAGPAFGPRLTAAEVDDFLRSR